MMTHTRGLKDILLDVLQDRGGQLEVVRLEVSIVILIALLIIAQYASWG
jgi:hypothetical protein